MLFYFCDVDFVLYIMRIICIFLYIQILYGGIVGVMIIVIGNGQGDQSSKPG